MSLSSLNATQEAQVLEILFESTASSDAPLLILESFMMGVFCACVPLASYMLWVKSQSFPRIPSIWLLWIVLVVFITHWALTLRQLESTFSGRSLGISDAAFWRAVNDTDGSGIRNSYITYGSAWQSFLLLTTETILFGFASVLFATTVFTSFWQSCTRWRSCVPLVIPVMASIMYTSSLVNWASSIHAFIALANSALPGRSIQVDVTLKALPVALFSINVIMSDAIVLWRMCVVWNYARPIVVVGIVLLVATLGLNIANGVVDAANITSYHAFKGVTFNGMDTEALIAAYGLTSVGLGAAFISLGSNLCATALVGLKAWSHRRQFSVHYRSHTRRTLAERFMELLVESGVVYTTLWLLYCVSFFRPITTYTVFGRESKDIHIAVTAVGHLDAAFAQLTSIYPLFVFLLVALDRIPHSRVPEILHNKDWPKERSPAEIVTVTFEVDVERSATPNPDSAQAMMEDIRQHGLGEGDGKAKKTGSENK